MHKEKYFPHASETLGMIQMNVTVS